MGGARRSVLSGKHALAKIRSTDKDLQQAIQILHSVFSPSVYDASTNGEDQRQLAHPHSTVNSTLIDTGTASKTLIMPRGPGRLPCHVLPNGEAQPWALLPMREAARRQYPDLLGQSCTFFHALDSAVTGKRPSQLVCCNKATLDLAKLMRNLGVIAGFEVLQASQTLKKGLQWTQGEEPDSYANLYRHKGLKIRLDIRWDALKPLAAMPATGHVTPLSTADGLPLSTRHLSRPSVPTLMTAQEVQATLRSLPAGIIIAYHHELGLTCDAALVHYNQPGLVLAHVALPWIQVAQITAAVNHKAQSEKGIPLDDTVPLTHWRISTWLDSTLGARQQALEEQALDIVNQKLRIKQQVQAMNQKDAAQGTEAMISGQTLQKQVQAYSLLNKLTAATGHKLSLPPPSQPSQRDERDQQARSRPPARDQNSRHSAGRREESDRPTSADRPSPRLFGPPGGAASTQSRAFDVAGSRRPRGASKEQNENRVQNEPIASADTGLAAVGQPAGPANVQATVAQQSAMSPQGSSVTTAEIPASAIEDSDPRELPGPVPESLLPPSVRMFQQRMNKKPDVEDDR